MLVHELNPIIRCQKNYEKLVLVKREIGVNPIRTRHRNKGAKPIYHWETGKMVDAKNFKSGDLPVYCTQSNYLLYATSNW